MRTESGEAAAAGVVVRTRGRGGAVTVASVRNLLGGGCHRAVDGGTRSTRTSATCSRWTWRRAQRHGNVDMDAITVAGAADDGVGGGRRAAALAVPEVDASPEATKAAGLRRLLQSCGVLE